MKEDVFGAEPGNGIGVRAHEDAVSSQIAQHRIEQDAITAVLDLIRTGACALPPIEPGDAAAELPPGPTPEVQTIEGFMESGATAMKNGLLSFAAVAWLLAPVMPSPT